MVEPTVDESRDPKDGPPFPLVGVWVYDPESSTDTKVSLEYKTPAQFHVLVTGGRPSKPVGLPG